MESAGETAPSTTLFGDFWSEGEISILFSDAGCGKSILAMQIADCLTRGMAFPPFEASAPEKVLYFDYEMTEQQFAERYSIVGDDKTRESYLFSDDLLRAEAAFPAGLPEGFKTLGEFTFFSFQQLLESTSVRAIIVDNIMHLKGLSTNLSAALEIMKGLRYLRDRYGTSILVLAHTPKRPFKSPLSLNHLQGSNMLSNSADNVFALGASQKDKDLRYLKQLKRRGRRVNYDASKVMLLRLARAGSFLGFAFEDYGSEREHLRPAAATPVENLKDDEAVQAAISDKLKDMHYAGLSYQEIADAIGLSKTTVSRYIKLATALPRPDYYKNRKLAL